MVLEVVVGVEDVVLAVVLVLHGHLDGGEAAAHGIGIGLAVAAPPVGEARPFQVHLGEIGLRAPRALLDDGEDARPIPTRRRAPQPGVLATSRSDRVVGRSLVEGGHESDGVVEQFDDVGERIAEEAADPQGHVDPGPAQSSPGNDLEPGDPLGLRVPGRSHAEQRERLRHVVPSGAHGGRAPQDEPDGGRVGAGLVEVTLDQALGQGGADLPGQWGRHRLGVDRVEVPPRREHVGSPAAGGPARTGGDMTAGEAGEQVAHFVGGPAKVGHETLGDPAQRGVIGGVGVPAARRQRFDTSPALRIDAVDVESTGRPERHPELLGDGGPQRRHRTLRETGDGEDGVDERVALGCQAEDVEAAPDLGVLEGAEVAVDVQEQIDEVLLPGQAVAEVEIAVDLGGDEHLPHLLAQRRCLGRVHGGHRHVGIEQLLQPGEVVVGVGTGHRRRQVVDDDTVGPALGLGPFAGIVDDEGIEQREVGQSGVGEAGARQRQRLAGQPLESPVLAEVDERVGTPASVRPRRCQPPVEGEVVMRWRQVGCVVRSDGVGAESAGRLDGDQDVAEVEPGEVQGAVGDVDVAGGCAPDRLHAVARLDGQGGEPVLVGVARQRARGQADLHRAQTGAFVGEPLGELVHEGIALGGDAFDGVPLGSHGAEQLDCRRWGVEADGVAQPRPLGGVSRQHDGDAPLPRGCATEAGRAGGERGQAGGSSGVSPGGDHLGALALAVVDDLLEGKGGADHSPVELGDGDAHCDVERREPGVVDGPLGPGAARGRGLEDRDSELVEVRHLPPVAAVTGGAGGQRRGDEDIDAVLGAQVEGGYRAVGVAAQ